ncbi:MAG: M6 family metalloprotease domain-containing protein [bacterium]
MLNIFWKYWKSSREDVSRGDAENAEWGEMEGKQNAVFFGNGSICLIMICGWLLLLAQPVFATPPLYPGMGGGHRDDVAPMHHRMAEAAGRLLAPGEYGIGNKVYTTGTVAVLALMVEFSDVKFAKDRGYFKGLMDQFAAYYQKNSYGKLKIVWAIATSTVNNTMSYYGYKDDDTLIEDAVLAADEAVNFSQYNALMVVHAGQGQESNINATELIYSQFMYRSVGIVDTYDGADIYGACIVPEHEGNASPFGIFCHEFGHQLGLPDLYDTGLDSEGIGNWSLMSSGAWNGYSPQGSCPSYFDAWCKINLEWLEPQTVATTLIHQSISIPQAETNPVAYKLWNNTMDTREYFLVENRQGAYLPGKGLLIWHIDERQTTNDDKFHYMVALEQADGRQDLENKYNRGDTGDPYPGNTGNRDFDDMSIPNSRTYSGVHTYIAVTSISDSAGTMTADLCIAPTIVTLKSPENNAICGTNTTITFEWIPIETASYHLIINGVGTFSCGSATTHTINVSQFTENTNYAWKVMAVSGYGTTTSGTWCFWINAVQSPPSQPILLSPCNGQTISQQTPTFRWQASTDPDPGDEVSYVIQYSKQPAFGTYTESGTITDNSYTTQQSLDEGTYYWRVKAVDRTGNSTLSGTGTFTVSMITGNGGTSTGRDGTTTVTFPKGAVSGTVGINILMSDEIGAGAQQAIKAATNMNIDANTIRQVEITSSQTTFAEPVTIQLPYFGTNTQVAIYSLTPDSRWEILPSSVNPASHTVQSQVYCFSVFGVAPVADYIPAASMVSSVTNWPNPFVNGQETTIYYVLKEAANVSINIYNPIGELVWNAQFPANSNGARQGGNVMAWDGKNGEGERVSQGIYFCVVEANSSREIRKIGVR